MFTGREFNQESLNYYYRARTYSFNTGRFLQRDSHGYKEGMNLYTYVNNNPINFIDPIGLSADHSKDGCPMVCGLAVATPMLICGPTLVGVAVLCGAPTGGIGTSLILGGCFLLGVAASVPICTEVCSDSPSPFPYVDPNKIGHCDPLSDNYDPRGCWGGRQF